jgi:hypothetical protein
VDASVRLREPAQRRHLLTAAIARQIEAVERGEPLQDVIDRARGY